MPKRQFRIESRPYIVTTTKGGQFLATSQEVYNLVSAYAPTRKSANMLTLRNLNGETEAVIVPATIGGGPAFPYI